MISIIFYQQTIHSLSNFIGQRMIFKRESNILRDLFILNWFSIMLKQHIGTCIQI